MTPLTTIDWTDTGLVGLTGMEFWHQFNSEDSADNLIKDYSGNLRHITCDVTGAPVLTQNVLNGQPGWYFDGTNNALEWAGADFTAKHIFIVVQVDEATFSDDRTLLGGVTTGTLLIGSDTTTKFAVAGSSYTGTYLKNDTAYTDTARQAPMQAFALIEIVTDSDFNFDGGISVNKDANYLGYFVEQMGWSGELSDLDRRRVLLYFNLRYRVFRYGVPLYFPSSDLVPALSTQPLVRNRFNEIPQDWDSITESFEYEDKGKDFNEVADDMPRMWEYLYQNVPKSQKVVFDEFNNAARRANSFYFKDPEGTVWSNVHISQYNRAHEAHKRWRNDVTFEVVGYDSVPSFEGILGGESDITFGGEGVVFGGEGLSFGG